MTIRGLTTLLAPCAAAMTLAACGSDYSGSSGSTGTNQSSSGSAPMGYGAGGSSTSSNSGSGAAITVKESEFKLAPADATVTAKGGKVTITASNTGKIAHALSLEKAGPGGKDLETSTIQPGASAKLTAKLKPGTYEWYCPVGNHKSQGMVGKLTVR